MLPFSLQQVCRRQQSDMIGNAQSCSLLKIFYKTINKKSWLRVFKNIRLKTLAKQQIHETIKDFWSADTCHSQLNIKYFWHAHWINYCHQFFCQSTFWEKQLYPLYIYMSVCSVPKLLFLIQIHSLLLSQMIESWCSLIEEWLTFWLLAFWRAWWHDDQRSFPWCSPLCSRSRVSNGNTDPSGNKLRSGQGWTHWGISSTAGWVGSEEPAVFSLAVAELRWTFNTFSVLCHINVIKYNPKGLHFMINPHE